MDQIEIRIAGIPALAGITHFVHVPPFSGSSHMCDSSDDYYGYTEVEWDVLDRKGRPAPWLEKKLTAKEKFQIETDLIATLKSREKEDDY
jgi:hypothetical protein